MSFVIFHATSPPLYLFTLSPPPPDTFSFCFPIVTGFSCFVYFPAPSTRPPPPPFMPTIRIPHMVTPRTIAPARNLLFMLRYCSYLLFFCLAVLGCILAHLRHPTTHHDRDLAKFRISFFHPSARNHVPRVRSPSFPKVVLLAFSEKASLMALLHTWPPPVPMTYYPSLGSPAFLIGKTIP